MHLYLQRDMTFSTVYIKLMYKIAIFQIGSIFNTIFIISWHRSKNSLLYKSFYNCKNYLLKKDAFIEISYFLNLLNYLLKKGESS